MILRVMSWIIQWIERQYFIKIIDSESLIDANIIPIKLSDIFDLLSSGKIHGEKLKQEIFVKIKLEFTVIKLTFNNDNLWVYH